MFLILVWDGRIPAHEKVKPMIALRDPREHTRRRRPWNRAFSTTALKGYEIIISQRSSQLVVGLADQSGTLDLSKWLGYFSWVHPNFSRQWELIYLVVTISSMIWRTTSHSVFSFNIISDQYSQFRRRFWNDAWWGCRRLMAINRGRATVTRFYAVPIHLFTFDSEMRYLWVMFPGLGGYVCSSPI